MVSIVGRATRLGFFYTPYTRISFLLGEEDLHLQFYLFELVVRCLIVAEALYTPTNSAPILARPGIDVLSLCTVRVASRLGPI